VPIDPQLSALHEKFVAIFGEIQGLPPKRSHDHQITLMQDTEPINLRPHKHSLEQKNAIEKMIEEMISDGIIRQCMSSHGTL